MRQMCVAETTETMIVSLHRSPSAGPRGGWLMAVVLVLLAPLPSFEAAAAVFGQDNRTKLPKRLDRSFYTVSARHALVLWLQVDLFPDSLAHYCKQSQFLPDNFAVAPPTPSAEVHLSALRLEKVGFPRQQL